jgi:Lon-like protease
MKPLIFNNQSAANLRRSTGLLPLLTWIIALPLATWAILILFLPILGGILTPLETWTTTALIVALGLLSLLLHASVHRWFWHGPMLPLPLPLFLFGDASQAWPETRSVSRDILADLAAPLANLVLAGVGYLAWNAQLTPVISLTGMAVAAYNGWLFVINLIPAFPFDGGRLVQTALRAAGVPGVAAGRWVRRMGFAVAALLAAWGIGLIAQPSRFSVENGAVSWLFAALVLVGNWARPAGPLEVGPEDRRLPTRRPGGILVVGLAVLILGIPPTALLLTNSGLEAPGLALSVEPMVTVPAQYSHAHAGTFILTSVLEQAPITAGEWLIGQVDPAIKIVPPQTITPADTTPQEQAREGFQMLDQSTATAVGVGMQLAGFPATISGTGVQVVSVIPESHAHGLLQPGDVITALNGEAVHTTADLISRIKTQQPGATVDLQVEQEGNAAKLSIPLLPPSAPGGSPRLGISIQTAGFDVQTPFPVSITPQKIVGGPSAGLMFTLTVYNALSPEDLTGGRRIAGTGTINPDGSVGPIGGVQQKVAAAKAAGATIFLSPAENYADALSAAKSIRVVKILTVQEAVDYLKGLKTP